MSLDYAISASLPKSNFGGIIIGTWLILSSGEQIVFSGPNTNTTTIQYQKFGRIQVRVLFGLEYMAEYEYEYYSGSEIWPNMNTNTIWSATFVRIRIVFGF